MPFNGSGVFNRLYNWIQDAAAGIDIEPVRVDGDANDIAAGLSQCLTRNGQSPATANIPMGGFKLTGVAAGVAINDAVNVGQLSFAGYASVVGDGVTDQSAAIAAANALGLPIKIIGVCVVGTATTITVPIVDTMAQIFTPASLVTIANGLPIRPEWFGSAGGNVYVAAKALPQPLGGVVLLAEATYPSCGFSYGGTYMNVPNVTFRGARMPRLSVDCKSLQGGTIINGIFLIYADNVGVENLGIDSGNTFTNGGTAQDGLLCTYNSPAAAAANALCRDLRLHNVIGLCNGPNDLTHGVIVGEGYTNVTCTGEIVGVYGVHGVVIKCAQVKAEQLTAYLNGTDGVIIKTDTSTTNVSMGVQIDRILTLANGPNASSPYALPTTTSGTGNFGVLLQPDGGNISKVQIGQILESGHAMGVMTQFGGAFVLDAVQIGCIITDGNADWGVNLNTSSATGATIQRMQIDRIEARNATHGVVFDWLVASGVKVGSIHATNCSVAAVATTGIANPVIDTVNGESCGAVYVISGTSRPMVGKTVASGTTSSYYTSAETGQAPGLSNSWAQVPGADSFNVVLNNYGIQINGLITAGTTNVIMTLPQFAAPASEKRFLAQGRAGGTQSAVPVQISASGVVTINDAAGGIANVSNYLSLAGLSYGLSN